jgi:hypothetical protein
MATAPSLFGASPELIQQQRAADIEAQAEAASGRDINQQVRYSDSINFNRLGDRLGGLLGGQDPAMQKASALRSLSSGLNFSTPTGLSQYAQRLRDQGFAQESFQASQQAQAMSQQGAELRKSSADAGISEAKAARNIGFEAAFATLPKDASDKDKLDVALRFGEQGDVIKAVEGSQNKEAARAAAITAATVANDRAVEAATARGDNAIQLRQMSLDNAKLIAALKGGTAPKPLAPSLQKLEDEGRGRIDGYEAQQVLVNKPMSYLRVNPQTGKPFLELGPIKNLAYEALLKSGSSSPESLAYADMKSAVTQAINIRTDAAKGVQTDNDVKRQAEGLIAAFASGSSAGVLAALERFNTALATSQTREKAIIDGRRNSQGQETLYGSPARPAAPAPARPAAPQPAAPASASAPSSGWGVAKKGN